MQQSLKVVTGFTLVPVEERRNVGEGIRSALASVKQRAASSVLRWLGVPSRFWTRVAGETFTHGQVLLAYAMLAAILAVLGLVGNMEGGAL